MFKVHLLEVSIDWKSKNVCPKENICLGLTSLIIPKFISCILIIAWKWNRMPEGDKEAWYQTKLSLKRPPSAISSNAKHLIRERERGWPGPQETESPLRPAWYQTKLSFKRPPSAMSSSAMLCQSRAERALQLCSQLSLTVFFFGEGG